LKRQPKNLKPGDIVYLEWRDASGEARWGDFESAATCIIKTSGFYIGLGKDQMVWIAGDISPFGNYGSRSMVPIENITKFKKVG
jgi:hypothetical protein